MVSALWEMFFTYNQKQNRMLSSQIYTCEKYSPKEVTLLIMLSTAFNAFKLILCQPIQIPMCHFSNRLTVVSDRLPCTHFWTLILRGCMWGV